MSELKFYVCGHCGNIITYMESKGVPVMCCGEKMKELVANTTDAAVEKHVPVIKKDGNSVVVEVGSVAHPMLDVHFIQWIILEKKDGFAKVELKPGMEPKAVFALAPGEEPVAAYAYCNLHGLWKTEA